jgi:hypothetical protein
LSPRPILAAGPILRNAILLRRFEKRPDRRGPAQLEVAASDCRFQRDGGGRPERPEAGRSGSCRPGCIALPARHRRHCRRRRTSLRCRERAAGDRPGPQQPCGLRPATGFQGDRNLARRLALPDLVSAERDAFDRCKRRDAKGDCRIYAIGEPVRPPFSPFSS